MTGTGTVRATILDIEGLSTGFGGNTVLHDLDFHVRRGEVAGLLGLNGAGKSVTLKVIAGLVAPWAGRVLLEGRDLSALGPEERVEAGLGHVTQGRQVFPDLTVEDNLRLGAYVVRRRNRARYEPLLAEMYDRFPRLAERRGQLAGGMSGGEQAMLAVARALMSEPRLLLIDEPSAGLAPAIIGDLVELIRDVKKSGVTILLVEQNIAFALQVADRVHVMQKGSIVHEGDVETIDRASLAGHLGIGRLLSQRIGVRK